MSQDRFSTLSITTIALSVAVRVDSLLTVVLIRVDSSRHPTAGNVVLLALVYTPPGTPRLSRLYPGMRLTLVGRFYPSAFTSLPGASVKVDAVFLVHTLSGVPLPPPPRGALHALPPAPISTDTSDGTG
jgi:hypothetical protein